MIVLISPAKSIDFNKQISINKFTIPELLDHSEILITELKKKSPNKLMDMMKVSSKLAYLNYERFQQWQTPFTTENARQAVFVFSGEVYTGLKVDSFSKSDLEYAQLHLGILSGLYGFLRPLDLIQPYRLEMGTSFKTKKWKDLYHFWGTQITDSIQSKLDTGAYKPILINLASNEYFKALQTERLNAQIVTPVFKEFHNGAYKFMSVFGKKARGMMAAYIIKNKIQDPEQLKLFDMEGYYYNDRLSSEIEFVFTRG
ncbi:MAG: peroxide stress protein YaaA [Bacteroidales bacterium]